MIYFLDRTWHYILWMTYKIVFNVPSWFTTINVCIPIFRKHITYHRTAHVNKSIQWRVKRKKKKKTFSNSSHTDLSYAGWLSHRINLLFNSHMHHSKCMYVSVKVYVSKKLCGNSTYCLNNISSHSAVFRIQHLNVMKKMNAFGICTNTDLHVGRCWNV